MVNNTPCIYYNRGQCQICTSITQSYSTQIAAKELRLLNQLKLSKNILLPSQQSPLLAFRDKMKLQVGGTIDQTILGFLNPKSLEVTEPIEHCPLHHPKLNQLIVDIKKVIKVAQLQPYDVNARKGELKGIISFFSPTTQQSYIRFILRSKESLDRLVKFAPDLLPVNVITANIQPVPHAFIEGPEEIKIKGVEILHRFNDHELFLSTQGFVQTNTTVAQALYAIASSWISEFEIDKLCDVYCGHGPFLFHLEKHAKQAFGIEINASAVELAKKTAQAIKSMAEFIAASSSSLEHQLKSIAPDLIIVNPPRAGLSSFLPILLAQNPRLILYSSCNVETLAADLAVLKTKYRITKVQLFDMFPHTNHFEVLVLLQAI
jgi:23S rRNA (uracil747-C5)-methyltransferase